MADTITHRPLRTGGGGSDMPSNVLQLPSAKSTPVSDISDYVWLMYGEKKIGKTSLAAQFPDALFLMFEPGGKSLSIYQMAMPTWATFVQAINLLASEDGDRFRNVVIDTVDISYELCFKHMCQKLAINHPTDENDFGKSWGLIETEFKTQIKRLLELDKGVMFISHATEAEIKTRQQGMYNRVVPTVPKQAARYLTGVVDLLVYYGYYDQERYLVVNGGEHVQAGVRCTNNFRTPSGERIVAIPMGANEEEAYANTIAAYENQQTEVYDFTTTLPTIQDVNATLKVKSSKGR